VGVVAPCFVFMLVVGCHRPRFYPAPQVKEYRRQIDELRGQIEELRRDSLEQEIAAATAALLVRFGLYGW
jgi:hypothetical protein